MVIKIKRSKNNKYVLYRLDRLLTKFSVIREKKKKKKHCLTLHQIIWKSNIQFSGTWIVTICILDCTKFDTQTSKIYRTYLQLYFLYIDNNFDSCYGCQENVDVDISISMMKPLSNMLKQKEWQKNVTFVSWRGPHRKWHCQAKEAQFCCYHPPDWPH